MARSFDATCTEGPPSVTWLSYKILFQDESNHVAARKSINSATKWTSYLDLKGDGNVFGW